MNRFFIEIAFEGSNYHGWQIQKNAHTVQQELNSALKKVFRSDVETLGAGRTDTGVHAKEFFAHFDLDKKIPVKTVHSLNSILPHDIVVKKIFQVKKNAHARFDATSRTYEYWMYKEKNPFLKGKACFHPLDADIAKMNAAARILKETRDFSCFSKGRTDTKTNICKIVSASWKVDGDKMIFSITADRFLRNMVRAIVGTLNEIGSGDITISDFRRIIEGKSRSAAGESVPACGLYLMKVSYDWKNILPDEMSSS